MHPRCLAPQLWHRSNWHWYLKLELGYDARPGAASSAADILLTWDDRLPGRLHCLVHSVLYQRLDLAWGKQVCVGRQVAKAVCSGSVTISGKARGWPGAVDICCWRGAGNKLCALWVEWPCVPPAVS
jgi:hypothetical protein